MLYEPIRDDQFLRVIVAGESGGSEVAAQARDIECGSMECVVEQTGEIEALDRLVADAIMAPGLPSGRIRSGYCPNGADQRRLPSFGATGVAIS
jgi:hypothetical protein